MRVSCFVLIASTLATGCRKPPALTREQVRALIESSAAFQAPIDPGVVFIDTRLTSASGIKREFLLLNSLTLKEDGPFGMAGSTATASFT
jgi:hypothetical protein